MDYDDECIYSEIINFNNLHYSDHETYGQEKIIDIFILFNYEFLFGHWQKYCDYCSRPVNDSVMASDYELDCKCPFYIYKSEDFRNLKIYRLPIKNEILIETNLMNNWIDIDAYKDF